MKLSSHILFVLCTSVSQSTLALSQISAGAFPKGHLYNSNHSFNFANNLKGIFGIISWNVLSLSACSIEALFLTRNRRIIFSTFVEIPKLVIITHNLASFSTPGDTLFPLLKSFQQSSRT